MGIFEYFCESCDHTTDRFVSLAERPKEIPCETCGQAASFIVSAVKTTFHANDRKSIKGSTINRGGIRT